MQTDSRPLPRAKAAGCEVQCHESGHSLRAFAEACYDFAAQSSVRCGHEDSTCRTCAVGGCWLCPESTSCAVYYGPRQA